MDPEAQRKDNALDEDLEERDALVQRMRERDEQRTKRLEAEQGLSQQEIAELATRGTVDPLAREDDVKMMRKFARQVSDAAQKMNWNLPGSRRWRRRGAVVDVAVRESTRLVSERRRFRDGVRSTQAYLDKWEAKQLDLLQAEVDQEEQLFGDEQLTAEEKQQHELSKKILAMV